MGRTTGCLGVTLAAFLCIVGSHGALAQSATGCSLQQVGGTSRQILHCGDGIAITAEAGARYQLIDRNRDGGVDKVSLGSKAILLDVDSAKVGGDFQVVTPQAIAAVRGTRWAVDVQGGKTSVLVLRGRVSVTRTNRSAGGVLLGQGQGVDVDGGTSPLVVKTWPNARVAALMARLGQ
jgi:ferric-dicitrate binding protein FerR (iron transport regulator)